MVQGNWMKGLHRISATKKFNNLWHYGNSYEPSTFPIMKMKLIGNSPPLVTTLPSLLTKCSMLAPSQTSNGLNYGTPRWRISANFLVG
jgi:hypothetical protein